MEPIPEIKLPAGASIPVLGMGTFCMGDDKLRSRDEIRAIQIGLDLGMTLIDTAEMYGYGVAEELVGEAIRGRRNEVFLVSKVLPENATTAGTIEACERSLRRLGTDRLDMYLLHCRESVPPLENTVDGFSRLVRDGKIRFWGVSNFDVSDMEQLFHLPEGPRCQTNQVLYNLSRRGIEFDLLPWMDEHRMPIMAYSPLERGALLNHPTVLKIAQQHGATAAQIALAWVLRIKKVTTIPKPSTSDHVVENCAALNVTLTGEDLAELDKAFPPPAHEVPLEMI